MKKILLISFVFLFLGNFCLAAEKLDINVLTVDELKKENIVANSSIEKIELENAKKIILDLHKQTSVQIKNGYGPFLAAIYDSKGNLIAKMPNTVVQTQCCLNHAEMNAIREAQKILKSYDSAPYKLSIYITAEPCMMCAGGIMWSGIEKVYYSVSSKDVEKITGFDEGYKPDWMEEFKKRNIKVYGNIESEEGKEILKEYVKTKKEIYKPGRKG